MTSPAAALRHHLKAARAAFKVDDRVACETAARAALAVAPDDESARRLLARVLNRGERWTDALTEWRILTEAQPETAEYWFQAGRLELRLGRPGQAVVDLDTALHLAPDHGASWSNKAVALQRLNRWTEAEDCWRHAGQVPDPPPQATEKRLQAARRIADPEAAEVVWRRVLADQPGHSEATAVLAQMDRARIEQTRQAARRTADEPGWQTVLTLCPGDAEALRTLITLAQRRRDWPAARAHARALADALPDDPTAIRIWARTLTAAVGDGHTLTVDDADWQDLLACIDLDDEAVLFGARLAHRLEDWVTAARLWKLRYTTAPEDSDALLRWARSLTRADDPAAESAWEAVLEHLPDHPEALRVLVHAAGQRGDWDHAAALWRQICALTPDDTVASLNHARALEHAGQLEAAEGVWRALLDRAPRHPAALHALARTATRREDWAAAADLWERVQEHQPNDVTACRNRAQALERAGRGDASAAWESVLAMDPRHEEALRALARGAMQTEDWRHAITLWERLMVVCPNDAAARLGHARALDRMDSPEADAAWEDLLADDPNHEEALRVLGRRAVAAGDRPRAASLWHRLAMHRPDDVSAWTHWARACQGHPPTQDELSPWQEVLARFPDHPEALRAVAREAQAAGRTTEALEAWERLTRHDPTLIEPPLQIARLRLAEEDDAAAEPALLRVLALDPDHIESLAAMARLCARTGRNAESADYLEHWLRVAPDDTRPLLLRARQMAAKDAPPDVMIETWSAVLIKAPDHPEALISLARLHHARQDSITALGLWERLCAVRPDLPEAWRNRTRLLDQLERRREISPLLAAVDEIFGKSANGLVIRADIAEVARFPEKAERLLRRASCLAPEDARPWKGLGLLLWRMGDLSGALPALRHARDLSPADADIAAALVDLLRALAGAGEDPTVHWTAPRSGTGPALRVPDLLFPRVVEQAAAKGRPSDGGGQPLGAVVIVTGSLGPGGAERQVVATAVGLQEHCPEVSSVTVLVRSLDRRNRSDFFLPHLQEAGIPVMAYEGPDVDAIEDDDTPKPWMLPGGEEPEETEALSLLSAFPNALGTRLLRLYRHLRTLRPTVVHAWQDTTAIETATAAALAGVPRILLAARSLRPDSHRRLLPYLRPAYRDLLRLPWIQLTNNSQAGLDDYAVWLDRPLTCPITPNALDGAALRRALAPDRSAALRRDLGLPVKAPVIGGIMRLTEEKRPLLWLRAMAALGRKLPEARFVLLGDGPMRPEVETVCRTLGLADRAHLVGNHRDVVPWYGMMDALLLTSRVEGCPNVLLEAQAVGLPVVAPGVGGAPEAVDHGRSGWIVDPAPEGLVDRLAERLLHCLTDTAWRHQAATTGPAFVERRHGLEAALRATLNAYKAPFRHVAPPEEDPAHSARSLRTESR